MSSLSAEAKKLKALSMTECCQFRELRLDEDTSIPDSWVEICAPPSRGSLCSSVGWALGNGANANAIARGAPFRHSVPASQRDSRHSPKSLARDYLPAATGGGATLYLSTPPNSPCRTPQIRRCVRHSGIVKSPLFRAELLFGLVVSNLVTLLVGVCVGFFLCKRIEKKSV